MRGGSATIAATTPRRSSCLMKCVSLGGLDGWSAQTSIDRWDQIIHRCPPRLRRTDCSTSDPIRSTRFPLHDHCASDPIDGHPDGQESISGTPFDFYELNFNTPDAPPEVASVG